MSSIAATNAALAAGGMTHCSLRCGLRTFFLRPADRIVAGTLDDAQFHDLFLQETEGPLRVSAWRFGAGERDQPGLFLAIEDAGDGWPLALLALEYRVETLFDQPLPRSVDRREAGTEGRHDTFVPPTLASLGNIGSEQDLGLQDLTGGMRAFVDDRLRCLTFFCAQPDDVFPALDLSHDPIPGNVGYPARESQMPVEFNDAGHQLLRKLLRRMINAIVLACLK
jgi:hypothetical protein